MTEYDLELSAGRGREANLGNDTAEEELQGAQLNIMLDHAILDEIKANATQLRRPCHGLTREWIERAVAREEKALRLNGTPTGPP